jgi:hypothetical protein
MNIGTRPSLWDWYDDDDDCYVVISCAEENKQDEASRTDSVHWNSEVDRSVQTKNVGYYYFSIVENLLF